jgi:DNA-binding NtrC family response regulator
VSGHANVVRRTLDEIERDHILQVLGNCAGNRTRAAKLLGISIRGLRMKLAAYAGERSRSREAEAVIKSTRVQPAA